MQKKQVRSTGVGNPLPTGSEKSNEGQGTYLAQMADLYLESEIALCRLRSLINSTKNTHASKV